MPTYPKSYGLEYKYSNFEIRDEFYGFLWHVKDWDLDDPRIGTAKTLEEAKADIDQLYEDGEAEL